MDPNSPEHFISAYLIRLRRSAPFFATLALFARYLPSERVSLAATDGRSVYFHFASLSGFSQKQRHTILLHQVLHAALLHGAKCGDRDPLRWNLATDLAIDHLLASLDFCEPLPGAVQRSDLKGKPVEEIYEQLLKEEPPQLSSLCLNPAALLAEGEAERPFRSPAELEAYWRYALRRALLAPQTSREKLPTQLQTLGFDLNLPPPEEIAVEGEALLSRYGSLPDLQAILEGRGEGVTFSEEPLVRYVTTIGLGLKAQRPEEGCSAFRWMIEQAGAEWIQLFWMNLSGQMRARGKVMLLTRFLEKDPKVWKFVSEDFQKLIGMKG